MKVTLGGKLLPLQSVAVRSTAYLLGVFGAWGSSKTYGAAVKFLTTCLANPWTEVYGADQPFSIVVGLTRSVLKDSAYREIKNILPPELIAKEKNLPDWELHLINGHRIVFRTVKGMTEGGTCCAIWVDEAHKIPAKGQWLNYQARSRDMRARHRLVMASGLPEHGWLQEVFDGWGGATETAIGRGVKISADMQLEGGGTVKREAVFMHAFDNPHLPPETRATLVASTSASEARKYIEGRWMKPERMIYYELNHATHIVKDPGQRDRWVHIGFDVGDHSHVVVVQSRRQRGQDADGAPYTLDGWHVVDEWHANEVSTEELCRQIKARGWLLHPRHSSLYTDPTIRRDEIAAIRRVFPELPIIKKSRKDKADSTEAGYASTNVALRDAHGRTRLTFSDSLSREPHSLLWCLGKFRRKPNGHPDRDNVVDHASDALRYPVSSLMPVARGEHVLRDR